MEMVVPAESAEQVLLQWEALTESLPDHARSNFVAEIRFSAADDVWLSNAYGRDVCHITVGRFYPTEADVKVYFRYARVLGTPFLLAVGELQSIVVFLNVLCILQCFRRNRCQAWRATALGEALLLHCARTSIG